MLRSPLEIPCRTCGAEAGQPCRYMFHEPRQFMQMPGYHGDRKYVDFIAARDAEKALMSS